ncbi:MAG: right-handed parallel beta-helix repeat-containing protein [Acidobacteriia bacterium]|nr:right-handed parallel beta-helix repeat-containing protein [Terriglobia bacterium]
MARWRIWQRGLLCAALVVGGLSGTLVFHAQFRAQGAHQPGIYFYVATDGNDAWSGRQEYANDRKTDGPFATLARARDAIRQLKAHGKLDAPVEVRVAGGVYTLTEPLIFTPDDSGTAKNPIVYAAKFGEAPVVSGGREIRQRRPLSNKDGFARPELLHGKRPTEQLLGWVAILPEVKQGNWFFHEVFVNGQRRQRARSPNTGFYFTDGQISAANPAQFKYRGEDIRPEWAKQGDVEVVALQKWAEFRLPIKVVDESAHTVTLAQKRQEWGEDKNVRYWIENTRDALDAPGEWYLDRREGKLIYKPFVGEDIRRAEMVAPVLQQLVRFEGDAPAGRFVHDLTLRDFTFAYTDWSMPANGYVDDQAAFDQPAAVELAGAKDCSIERCLFTHLGQYAVEVHKGSRNVRVLGNVMTDLGAGGVKIGDPTLPKADADLTSGNTVSDNRIQDIGKVYPAAVGIWVGQSSDNEISHNEIGNTYYTGISVGWTWGYGATAARGNRLEFNHIHDIGRGLLSDMGCIYTLGVQPGTVERYNLCHDVTRYVHGYGGWGLYTDEGSSNILIENNVVYRAEDGGFHQHYGAENLVRNNIFAFGRTAEIRRTRLEPHRSFSFEHNIVYWELGTLLDGSWDDGNYHFDSNIYFRTDGKPFPFAKWTFEEWQKRDQDVHSLVADPLFRDPENADFSLRPGSPAERMTFQPIDLKEVGPRD